METILRTPEGKKIVIRPREDVCLHDAPHNPPNTGTAYTNGTDDTSKDRLREMADSATDQLKQVSDSAQDMAGKVAEQAREYGEKAQQAAKNFKPYVEKSMKEQPMQTLALASVIGFVLGALWKR